MSGLKLRCQRRHQSITLNTGTRTVWAARRKNRNGVGKMRRKTCGEIGHKVSESSRRTESDGTGFRALERINVGATEAVSSTQTSINPNTQDSITPRWAEMKNQSRVYGNEAEGKYGHWKAQRQAICRDEEGPHSFPSWWTQHVLPRPLQAPLPPATAAWPAGPPDSCLRSLALATAGLLGGSGLAEN